MIVIRVEVVGSEISLHSVRGLFSVISVLFIFGLEVTELLTLCLRLEISSNFFVFFEP